MTNKELWAQYEEYSRETSTIARSLGFGAVAICWIFKESISNRFSPAILASLISATVYFILDLSQYSFTAIIYGYWIRRAEIEKYGKDKTIEGKYDKPAWLDRPTFWLWIFKLIALALSYINIARHILKL